MSILHTLWIKNAQQAFARHSKQLKSKKIYVKGAQNAQETALSAQSKELLKIRTKLTNQNVSNAAHVLITARSRQSLSNKEKVTRK